MPGRRGQDIVIDPDLCRRCQSNDIAITVRTEPLCKDCFSKYVNTKVVKRMETFRVRHSTPDQERVLLLPLSLGNSSLALLHILSQHLQRQIENTGRTGFKLNVLHIILPTEDTEKSQARLSAIRTRYPQYTYHTHPLSDIFNPSILPPTDLPPALHHLLPPTDTSTTTTPAEKLTHLLTTTPHNPTSRADLCQIVLHTLLLHLARTQECEALLLGSSTTRLAQRTLAETAKGRGYSLPHHIGDGEQGEGGAMCYYPMRDLLGKEIQAFVEMLELQNFVISPAREGGGVVSTRNMTIDELVGRYFEGVEREFPSVVSNVVRTVGKLERLSGVEQVGVCELCRVPLNGAAPERSRLCYGCIRTLGRKEM